MKFYISSQCSAQKRIGSAVAELADLGFSAIELTGGTAWYEGMLEELEQLRTKRELTLMLHNYFPPQREEFVLNLAVKDAGRSAAMKTFIRDALRLNRRYGQTTLGVHPGFRQDVKVEQEANGFFKAGDPTQTDESAFYTMLDELNALAREEGARIAIENLAPRSADDPFSFVTHPADIEKFLNALENWPHLGVLVDFGHMGAAAATFGFHPLAVLDRIFERPERVLEIHLSENDGMRDAHAVTKKDSWHIEYLRENGGRLGDIPVVFEWSRAANLAAVAHFNELVSELSGEISP